MKRYIIPLISILIILALIQSLSCKKDQATFPVFPCPSLPDSTHIHYVTDSAFDPNSIQYLVTQYCSYQSGCHNQGSVNGDFTIYQGIKAKVDNGSLYQRVVVQRDMPPSFSYLYLDSCEIKEFYLWIKEGAPQY